MHHHTRQKSYFTNDIKYLCKIFVLSLLDFLSKSSDPKQYKLIMSQKYIFRKEN